MARTSKPTDAELEILQLLWQGPQTVRTVNDTLNEKRQVGYTTTLKIMQIMFEKGSVERQQQGRGHLYSAVYKEQETQKMLLDRFMQNAFGGSALKLVMQALGNRKTSQSDLAEIKDYLTTLEGEEKL